MSDGSEERKEQEERRKWEEERKKRDDDRERDWERDGDRERRDSLAVELLDTAVRTESGRRTRRSFLVAAAAAAGGYGFYRWIDRSPGDQLIPRPLRKMLNFNAKVARGVFDERGLAPTYSVSKSMELRTNGNYGLRMKPGAGELSAADGWGRECEAVSSVCGRCDGVGVQVRGEKGARAGGA